MEFLDVPLYDDDLWKMLVRLVINLAVVSMIVFLCFYRHKRSQSYAFTLLIMNLMIFFICFSLKKLDLGLGLALGLFAIFAIIRYRTDAMRVKEMTYLFVVIGVAVINALSNKKTSYAELFTINAIVFGATFLLERVLIREKKSVTKQMIVYDNLSLLRPENLSALLDDLTEKLGRRPEDVKIGKIDFQKLSATLTLYFLDSSDTRMLADDNGMPEEQSN